MLKPILISFILSSAALCVWGDPEVTPNKIENMQTAELDRMLAQGKYEDLLFRICPNTFHSKGCYGYFEKWYLRNNKYPEEPTVIDFEDDDEHVNYIFHDRFFLKTFSTPEDFTRNYAIYEINLGLKVRDSIRANGITNLAEVTDCCHQETTRGLNHEVRHKWFLRFPLFEQGSIRKFIEGQETQAIANTLVWKFLAVRSIANGVRILHSRKYAHRDLKPDNILVGSDGWDIVLTDYGFNKKIDVTTNTMGGTPIFMAPEMKDGKDYKLSVDLWNLGSLIHYITVPKPFAWTQNWHARIFADCQDRNIAVDRDDPKYIYCRYFHAIITKLLSVDPAKRGTSEEAYQAINQVTADFMAYGYDFFFHFMNELKALGVSRKSLGFKRAKAMMDDAIQNLIDGMTKDADTFNKHLPRIHPEWMNEKGEFDLKNIQIGTQYYSWINTQVNPVSNTLYANLII